MRLRLLACCAFTSLVVYACGTDGVTSTQFVDTDADGILDVDDECPTQPETVNRFNDTDGCPDQTTDLYNMVRTDVEAFWQTEFSNAFLTYTPISTFQAYTMPILTPCDTAKLQNAFYCASNQGVYYDTNFLDGFLSSIGDMAPAFVIAHELGHHVSNLRGFVRPVHSQKQVELQADCFAGAWTANVDSRGLLETGDLEEAVRILVVGGDSANTWFLPNAHGTSAQRVAAATMGYQMGSSTCTAPDFLRTIPSAALSYSGNQFVEAPDHTDLDLGNTWTIEAWVAPMDPTVPTTQALISKGTWQTVGDAAYSLVRNFDGRLFVITSNGVSQSIVESSTPLVANAWNHLAVTFDNGTVTTYINGAVQSEAGAVVPINASGPLTFGRIGPSPSFLAVAPFTGLIDEVRMWNVVRSQTEIATTRNELVTPSEPGLVGYWRFNVGFEDVAYDATERGHNGRLGSLVGPDINDPQWDVGAPLPAASRSSR